ncbi:DUF169 domain-containing protein [Desulfospira joergensenii]|uniref:DUF169 domain-containing protein n=1 Tax=Desulfospira joergensenii TaxID=53329 RepID=UPI0003B32BCA|nr:DUF169 domain-containing protein [Desulfospira joergensenii]
MDKDILATLPGLLEILGMDEEPMGMFFTDEQPDQGYTPDPADLPTREKEKADGVDWAEIFSQFSCVMGKIWLARKKKSLAWFSASHFGCPGGAFWMGFNKPQAETIIHYVSTGIPGRMKGEFYCDSPDHLRQIFEQVDPEPAPKSYCVFKPLSLFREDETPVLISFFSRPEALCGLHQLATFVTNDPEVVASPWSAACGGLVAWPMHYLAQGRQKAVLGGWDPSARKFFKTDEISFTLPYDMFAEMTDRYEESFLKTDTWQNVHKKIGKSKRTWDKGL